MQPALLSMTSYLVFCDCGDRSGSDLIDGLVPANDGQQLVAFHPAHRTTWHDGHDVAHTRQLYEKYILETTRIK